MVKEMKKKKIGAEKLPTALEVSSPPAISGLSYLSKGEGEEPEELEVDSADEQQLKAKAKKDLFKAAPKAVKRLSEIIDSADEIQARAASNDILEKIGLGGKDSIAPPPSGLDLSKDVLIAALAGLGTIAGVLKKESEIGQLKRIN